MVPVGVSWCASFRGEDEQAVTIAQVHRRCRVALAAFGASGREQKQGSAFPYPTNFAFVRTERLDCLAIPVIYTSHNFSSIFYAGYASNYLACEVCLVSIVC
jgi:hypothetical protein